jgi:hypothetical protein
VEALVGGLLKIIEDPEPKVRQQIFGFFLGLCQVRKDLFISFSNSIFPKLAKSMWDTDKAARRACFMVFWEFLAIHDDEESTQVIQLVIPYLPDIVPALVVNSVLTDEDKENLLGAISQFVENNKVYEKGMQDEEEGNLQLEDEEQEVLDANGAYTIRKLSLRCLIKIFEFMGNHALSLVKPHLAEMFASKEPLKIEAAACVLGSVGNYCLDELKPDLGAFLTKLLSCAESNNQFLQ